MIYTKYKGTILNAEALINLLATTLVNHGWTQEFIGDNIISSLNLGKKLIMKKGSVYTYFAASDNNNPAGNTASFVNNSISCLRFCNSLTLNTSNNWYSNNIHVALPDNTAGIQISTNSTYYLYVNDDNFILTVNFATGLYSTMICGDTTKNTWISIGSIIDTRITSGRLNNKPIFKLDGSGSTYFTLLKNKTTLVPSTALENNLFIATTSTRIDKSFYSLSTGTTNIGHINRATSVLYDISMLFNIRYYETVSTNSVRTLCNLEDVFVVNFSSLSSDQTENEGVNIGSKTFDFIPFLRKESPQIYSNSETLGCGFAVRVG